MKENQYQLELVEKINNERTKLNSLVLKGLGREELLQCSQKIDRLINEYYQLV